MDPSGTVDGLNLYYYVHAKLLEASDPTGRETFMNTEALASRFSGALLESDTAPDTKADVSANNGFLESLDPPVFAPQDYYFPLPWGTYDSYIDRSVARSDIAAKMNRETITSGSVVVEPADRLKALAGLVYNEVGYLSAGIFYLAEHLGGTALGLVGAGLNAIEEHIPGFMTTLDSLQGVPFAGPEVEAAHLAIQFAPLAVASRITNARQVRHAPAGQIFSSLNPAQIDSFSRAGRHVLQVEALDSGLQFWAVSGPGGAIGHTEYVAAMWLRELGQLETGSSFLLSGIHAPCQRGGGCSSLLAQVAMERGVNFMYLARGSALSPSSLSKAGRELPRGISFFEGGLGRLLKGGGVATSTTPPHIRLGIRTSLD